VDALITGKGIVKTFGSGADRVVALDGVDIEIERGSFVAIMGPSGAGKSTLLFALSGADDITGGSVKFDGVELSGLDEDRLADIRLKQMGFVFQQPTMLRNLNLLDNIIRPAVHRNTGKHSAHGGRRKFSAHESRGKLPTHGNRGKLPAHEGRGKFSGHGSRGKLTDIVQRAESLMEKTGIAGLGDRDASEVSGGQLQRAGICRALINEPDILFADEPTGALNSKAADEIMGLLLEANREGAAILLVTHDAKVGANADRVLFTKDGAIVSELPLGKYDGSGLEGRTEKVVAQMTAMGI
jgi:putative ABC transport system ATP-binding protein